MPPGYLCWDSKSAPDWVFTLCQPALQTFPQTWILWRKYSSTSSSLDPDSWLIIIAGCWILNYKRRKSLPVLIKKGQLCEKKIMSCGVPGNPFLSAQSGVRPDDLRDLQFDGSICLCENNTLSRKGFLPRLLNPIPLQSSLRTEMPLHWWDIWCHQILHLPLSETCEQEGSAS